MAKRASVGVKIFWVAASFVLPISVLLWMMVDGLNGYIQFAQMEVRGGEYQAALEKLLQAVLDHQAASLTCPHPAECGDRLKPAATAVDQGFAAVKSADAKHGAALQFTAEGLAKRNRQALTIDQVERRWEAVNGTGMIPDAAAYAATVSQLRGMITHVGDTSNLILDPDLDSYYLMDVTLLTLPQTQDRLGKMQAIAAALHGEASPAKRQALAVEAALMQQADLDRAVSSVQTSFNEDANFYGVSPTLKRNLARPLQEYQQSSEKFIAMARRMADGETVTSADFASANAAARQASFAFWHTAQAELDVLLRRRIASFESQRAAQLGASFAAIGIACLLAWWMSRSITTPLKGLMRSLGPGATLLGNCVQRISETTASHEPDPVQTEVICEELNAHCESMRRAVLELARQVEGAAREASLPMHDVPVNERA